MDAMTPIEGIIPEMRRWANVSYQNAKQKKRRELQDSPLTVDEVAAILKYTAQDTEPPLFKHMNQPEA